ncbi:unnamed protein product [Rotaria sp. Silwood2]|nr:unnamed protein product [Rotaria sp. Silwood2]
MDMEETSPNSGWPLRAISLWDIKNQEIGLSIDEIERHITYVKSDLNFAAKLVYDRKLNDPLYMLDGETESVVYNFSGESINSYSNLFIIFIRNDNISI